MNINIADPLTDKRWDDLVARHPRASAFHQRGWLKTLAQTYGYEPLVLTSAPPGKALTNGLVLCRVSSWITGTRLVSLPFADHCEPLLDEPGELLQFLEWLREERDRQRWKYIELRPLSEIQDSGFGLPASHSYCFHELDTRPSLEQIFARMHKASIQRRIRRAEKAQLAYESGCSQSMVDEFYGLLLITRRRHHMLPQPLAWFRNLVENMGEQSQIRVARKDGVAIAALLTLRHGSSAIYKYGCSDEKFHSLGGMPFLFWKLIEESKACGVERIDFGRSDWDQAGLIAFKDKFGARRKLLTYYRYASTQRASVAAVVRKWQTMRQVFSILPNAVSSAAGRLLYKHMG